MSDAVKRNIQSPYTHEIVTMMNHPTTAFGHAVVYSEEARVSLEADVDEELSYAGAQRTTGGA